MALTSTERSQRRRRREAFMEQSRLLAGPDQGRKDRAAEYARKWFDGEIGPNAPLMTETPEIRFNPDPK